MHSLRHLGIVLLLAVFSQTPVSAHNGAVGLAVPVTGITVDGDLSDWPANARWYPIGVTGYGAPPADSSDFAGTFSVGYNAAENTLYLAAQVRDESVVLVPVKSEAPENAIPWDAQDGIEICTDLGHGQQGVPVVQFGRYGDWQLANTQKGGIASGAQLARSTAQRSASGHVYEWCIDVGRLTGAAIRAGATVGLDVAICDRDQDGSFSWMSWGRGMVKIRAPDRRGDMVLAAGEVGWLRGKVVGIDGRVMAHQQLRLQSLEKEELWVQVETDRQGTFAAELPVGPYRVEAGTADSVKESVLTTVTAGSQAQVEVVLPPPRGKQLVAGPGRRVPAGPGSWHGRWFTLGVEDGLPDGYLQRVIQDRRGNLWTGTFNGGISRYDGRSFTNFSVADGLPGNKVRSLFEDRHGNMWFGTEDGGVSRYDGTYFTTFTTEDGLAGNVVNGFAEDRQGNLWIATEGGVSCYDGQYFASFGTGDGLGDNAVETVARDRQGQLWFGTLGGGVSRYEGKEFTTFTTRDGLAHNQVIAIKEDRQGRMWFGTLGGGVSRYDGKEFTTFTTRDGLADNQVGCIGEDGEGAMWFGASMAQGLSRFDGRRFTRFTIEDGLADLKVEDIFADREGNLWFCLWGGGLSRYEGGQFATFTASDGLADDAISDVVQDRVGNLWFSTVKGVSRYDGRRFTTLTEKEGLVNNKVFCILEDRQGNLWFGTREGVSRYDGKAFTNFTTKDGLAHQGVWSIYQDEKGVLWFGCWGGGVSCYDGKEFKILTVEDGLGSNEVYKVAGDQQGRIWLGTAAGASRYDGEKFTNFTAKDGLAPGKVFAICADREQGMWFGTGGGVSRYAEGKFAVVGKFTSFTTADGLIQDQIRDIYQDSEGVLWFATSVGVHRYDGFAFQNLLRRDGMAGDKMWATLQDRSGDHWLVGAQGATRYRPRHTPPPVYLADVVVGKRYGPVAQINLSSTQDLLAFEFYGISFKTRPGAMLYRYRLRGYEEEWKSTRAERVEYQDLPIGQYTFEVQAIDRDLAYSEKPVEVQVQVRLPYERLGWIGVLAMALGMVGWQTYRVIGRGRRLQQANQALSAANKELFRVSQAKSSFLASMSHELRTPMNAILGFAQMLRGNQEGNLSGQQLSNLEVIGRNAGELLILIEQLLDLSRIEAGRMKVVAEYFEIREVVAESLAVVEPLVGEKGVALWADYEGEHQVFYTDRTKVKQILVNLLSNAIKFTEEGRVGVGVKGENGLVRLTVMDSGVGIAAEHLETIFEEFRQVRHPGMGQGTGLGLAITRRLCRLLGGEVSVASVPGQGSTFTVSLPVEWRGLEKEG